MNDNEIIKALECCKTNKCDECPIYKECHATEKGRIDVALDLINRQKAEIEMMKKSQTPRLFGQDYRFCNLLGKVLVFSKNLKDYNDMIKGLKTEGIKEFATSFKALFKEYSSYDTLHIYEILDRVDIIEEIMTEEQND